MNAKINSKALFRVINRITEVLPAFFWAFLIFGFEDPCMAVLSITAAFIHEGGHILSIFLRRGRAYMRGVLSGFRIRAEGVVSYKDELITYLAGPLTNIAAFVVFSLLSPALGEWAAMASVINLVTGLSNLLPIEGYDGYGILRALLRSRESGEGILAIIRRISSGLVFFFCIFSLYLIDRIGGGYWIFAVFFTSMIKCIKDDLE